MRQAKCYKVEQVLYELTSEGLEASEVLEGVWCLLNTAYDDKSYGTTDYGTAINAAMELVMDAARVMRKVEEES